MKRKFIISSIGMKINFIGSGEIKRDAIFIGAIIKTKIPIGKTSSKLQVILNQNIDWEYCHKMFLTPDILVVLYYPYIIQL